MAKKQIRTKVKTATCPRCLDEVYSRARRDFRTCMCDAVFVDGGFDYFITGAAPLMADLVRYKTRYVPYSKQELYDDWNCGYDELGVIKK